MVASDCHKLIVRHRREEEKLSATICELPQYEWCPNQVTVNLSPNPSPTLWYYPNNSRTPQIGGESFPYQQNAEDLGQFSGSDFNTEI
jgi:hypothetical protein